eukprot:6938720-Prymnesium_polylepis.1
MGDAGPFGLIGSALLVPRAAPRLVLAPPERAVEAPVETAGGGPRGDLPFALGRRPFLGDLPAARAGMGSAAIAIAPRLLRPPSPRSSSAAAREKRDTRIGTSKSEPTNRRSRTKPQSPPPRPP